MRKLSDVVDSATDPRVLAERIPGFADRMDAVVELRNSAEVSKFTKKPYDGWEHVGSVPPGVIEGLYRVYGPELTADGGKLLLKWLQRNGYYKVTNDHL